MTTVNLTEIPLHIHRLTVERCGVKLDKTNDREKVKLAVYDLI